MKTIGIDLDGTITPYGFCNPGVMKLPWWLFFFLIPFVLLFRPRKSVIEKMRLARARGCRLLIITSRPNQFFWFTERLLLFYHVPFDDLFCVGFGKGSNERKLEVILREKAEAFVDSNKGVLKFMKEHSILAFSNLDYLEKEGR